MPRRRGRPRKNKEVVEARFSEESRARSVAEKLLMHAIRLEPAGGSSREDRSRTRKEDITEVNDLEPSQQLKQAKLAIAELYQENMELRRQLATKITKASAVRGREGNVAWLKRWLREVQDTIVQLRETQRLMEERHMKHSRECEATEKEARVALANAEKTSLAGARLCTYENKTNLGSFEGHVSPKRSTILVMTATIKRPLAHVHFPASERVTEIKVVTMNNKFLTVTCSLGYLIKGIH
jgi:hypothetical protein